MQAVSAFRNQCKPVVHLRISNASLVSALSGYFDQTMQYTDTAARHPAWDTDGEAPPRQCRQIFHLSVHHHPRGRWLPARMQPLLRRQGASWGPVSQWLISGTALLLLKCETLFFEYMVGPDGQVDDRSHSLVLFSVHRHGLLLPVGHPDGLEPHRARSRGESSLTCRLTFRFTFASPDFLLNRNKISR
eukprot:scaffold122087_cov35-Prasinocladus_malaysianus.AAC.1